MKVAMFQMDVIDYNPELNRKKVEEFVENHAKDADLVILPEMFTTGYTMMPEIYAEPADGESVTWLKEIAKRYKKAFCGSICINDSLRDGTSGYFNRLYFITEDGITFAYDKRHLFRMAGEDEKYVSGVSKQIIHYKGVKILPLICYDLRFPVWSRNINSGYDLVIYIASWPEVRRMPWSALLKARAIENLSYCIGVNRVGTDANKLNYSGDSILHDFKGGTVWASEPFKEEMGIAEIDLEALKAFREKFPAQLDADYFSM